MVTIKAKKSMQGPTLGTHQLIMCVHPPSNELHALYAKTFKGYPLDS